MAMKDPTISRILSRAIKSLLMKTLHLEYFRLGHKMFEGSGAFSMSGHFPLNNLDLIEGEFFLQLKQHFSEVFSLKPVKNASISNMLLNYMKATTAIL
jgi:hypothetical protein